jgi:hypothetical protein
MRVIVSICFRSFALCHPTWSRTITISLSGYFCVSSSKKMFIISVFTSDRKRVKDYPENGVNTGVEVEILISLLYLLRKRHASFSPYAYES